jgi:hypothetical protein
MLHLAYNNIYFWPNGHQVELRTNSNMFSFMKPFDGRLVFSIIFLAL